ncbi:MmgE/PrpD family protein [Sandarakinorhabdus sp. DWP1-3-1]|uniref:MmgE/PrpD family protein n=1 Tax=Sandarakinorhabdus sp. DWP1-3-1 TaxID=2804627 RepID=UPI003CF8789D
MTATTDLLAFAAGPIQLPPAVRAAALMLLDDTLAVGAAGSTAPGADAVLAAARGWGSGVVPILGRTACLSAAGAAFVNGYQIHCLEWDAVHEPAVVHAMSVVTAALLSACHGRAVEREDALAALVVGVEIACALGVAATGPLRFFRPATAGLIGAALACARIAGVPPVRFADVLGLAHAQCAGTMQAHVEGSLALPLQVAAAARAAITAVDLVGIGLAGPHDALVGPFGYFPLFDDGDPAVAMATLGIVWRTTEVSIKPWPSGRASHATLSVLAGDITAIEARVPPLIARLVGRPWVDDMTTAYARLCLPFLVALMLTDGRIDPRRFTPDSFADPALRALGARLTVVVDGNPDPNALAPQAFTLTLTDGSRRDVTVPATLGSPANALTPAAHAEKLAFARGLAAGPSPTLDSLTLLSGVAATI